MRHGQKQGETLVEDQFRHRYGNGAANRSYFIADALIYMKSYSGTEIDATAERVSDEDVAAFHRVVAELNKSRESAIGSRWTVRLVASPHTLKAGRRDLVGKFPAT